MEVTGVVLAGGKSSRMGENKALLPINGKPNIENIIAKLQLVTNAIVISSNDLVTYNYLQLPIIKDITESLGPLGGIQSILTSVSTPYVFFHACDLPMLSLDVIQCMIELCTGYDVIVPKIDGKVHPVCGIYHKNVLPILEKQLANEDRKVMNLLNKLNVLYVERDVFEEKGIDVDIAFLNMNTPEDYKRVLQLH